MRSALSVLANMTLRRSAEDRHCPLPGLEVWRRDSAPSLQWLGSSDPRNPHFAIAPFTAATTAAHPNVDRSPSSATPGDTPPKAATHILHTAPSTAVVLFPTVIWRQLLPKLKTANIAQLRHINKIAPATPPLCVCVPSPPRANSLGSCTIAPIGSFDPHRPDCLTPDQWRSR